MGLFYGQITGNRGTATRMGSRDSGFHSSCQSYDGSVIVSMRYDENDKLQVRIGTSDDSSASSDWNSKDFNGSFEEFKNLLNLARDIKEGKVSIVRHRKKKETI